MGNYAPTGPFTNNAAPGISATFLNNLEAVLSQPSGGVEICGYFLSGWSNASGDLLSCYCSTLSRGRTILSVFVATPTVGPTNVASPTANQLGQSGFQMYTTSTSAQVSNLQVGGYTDPTF